MEMVAGGVVVAVRAIEHERTQGQDIVIGRSVEANKVDRSIILTWEKSNEGVRGGPDNPATREVLQAIGALTSTTTKRTLTNLLKATRRNPAVPPCRKNSGNNTWLHKLMETWENLQSLIGPTRG